ncbi:MAG TPA: AAA family ATPase [Candidatus Acidoferrales bacterium]|nr:AAA family ATPase [Candidatus Acidoferrales bacterium]
MIINNLAVDGFRIIGNRIEIEFPPSGTIAIFGENESGKSTLFEAIEFALFGLSHHSLKKEDLRTWNKQKLDVTLKFTSKNKQWQIERSITGKGTHRAKLVRLENGSPVKDDEITNLSAVQDTIEELLDMDRDSFSKLVYIRQKELDTLKDLQKQSREKLINKVMGIEDFDKASEKLNEDRKNFNTQMELLDQELLRLEQDHNSYLQKKNRIEELENEISESNSFIETNEKLEKQLEKELQKYEWLKNYEAKRSVLESKISEKNSIQEEKDEIITLKNKSGMYEKLFHEMEPDYTKVLEFSPKFEIIEKNLKAEEERLEKQRVTTPPTNESTKKDETKPTSFKRIMILLISGIIGMILGLIWIFLFIPGIILLIISIVYLVKYGRHGQTHDTNASSQILMAQLSEKQDRISEFRDALNKLQSESGFQSSEHIHEEKIKINSRVKMETSLSSLGELRGAISQIAVSFKNKNETEIAHRIEKLEENISQLKNELRLLEIEKPEQIESVNNREMYSQLLQNYGNVRTKVADEKLKKSGNNATLVQLISDCETLYDGFIQYPTKQGRKKEIMNELQLLEFIITQFNEVSRNMRSKVIPSARLLINQMLPTITGNRYSEFNISEDLKFTVYTTEGGSYKERELFSGGTQDQFLIVLRLAFTQSILGSKAEDEEYALFMDESISSSDQARKHGIFELLKAVEKTFRQIFIIAHEDISDEVEHHMELQRDQKGFTSIKSKSW